MTGRALILDCDGVLADTELDGHLVAFNRTFTELGLPIAWTADEYGELLRIGGGKERLRAYLAAHPALDLGDDDAVAALVAQAHQRKSAIYVDLVESGALPARPGIARLVHEALEAGWAVAIASTSALASVQAVANAVLDAEDLGRLSGIFAGDVVAAKKPAPDIYDLTVRTLGVDPELVIVVEDSQSGAAAAAAAGLRHLVTLSHFTHGDAFPQAATVVEHVGDADLPTRTVAGADVVRQGLVTVDSLEALLRTPRP